MKTFKIVLITILVLIILLGVSFFLIGYFKPKPGGLLVQTNPSATVYVNGQVVGETPYEVSDREPGEISLKLVPDKADNTFAPFETKVNLVSGIKTVVRREFGPDEETSSGEIVYFEKEAAFEKEAGNETSLVVVSIPDNAQVSLDGIVRGFAPYKTSSVIPGEHQISVKLPGYKERSIGVRVVGGYRLTAIVKLAKEEIPPEVQGEETEQKGVYVEILETPNNFLRVREEPDINSKELGRVKPGEKFLLVDDTQKDWFKIEFQSAEGDKPAKEGWVSSQYARVVEEPSSSPSP